jgi:hypothetical protein
MTIQVGQKFLFQARGLSDSICIFLSLASYTICLVYLVTNNVPGKCPPENRYKPLCYSTRKCQALLLVKRIYK